MSGSSASPVWPAPRPQGHVAGLEQLFRHAVHLSLADGTAAEHAWVVAMFYFMTLCHPVDRRHPVMPALQGIAAGDA